MTRIGLHSADSPFVAIAGTSARMLAQSAQRAGYRVAALDVFGDRDTRAVSDLWFDIAGSTPLTISEARVTDALQRLARLARPARTTRISGWIGTSGLEPMYAALASNPHLPRCLGNTPAAVAAVRTPDRFFALLDDLKVPHPEVAWRAPDERSDWLCKDMDSCGGMRVMPADGTTMQPDVAAPSTRYFQRRGGGTPMSALFVAARGHAMIVGFAEQLTVAVGECPYVYAGAIGPIEIAPELAEQLAGVVEAIVARTNLVGLNSMDFLLDGAAFQVLEINPRPSATMALYEAAEAVTWPHGLLGAHIEACLHGVLPHDPRHGAAHIHGHAVAHGHDHAHAHGANHDRDHGESPDHDHDHGRASGHGRGMPQVHTPVLKPSARIARIAGQRIVFAPCSFIASAHFSDTCLRDPCCHDIPSAGTSIDVGQPVCTLAVLVSAAEADGGAHAAGSAPTTGDAAATGDGTPRTARAAARRAAVCAALDRHEARILDLIAHCHDLEHAPIQTL
jgi:predicted ATP-grasp superfamily ATP-dependent carboligase